MIAILHTEIICLSRIEAQYEVVFLLNATKDGIGVIDIIVAVADLPSLQELIAGVGVYPHCDERDTGLLRILLVPVKSRKKRVRLRNGIRRYA